MRKIRLVIGIVAFFFGGVFLLDAMFVEEMWGNESVVSAVRATIALSLFGVGYFFGFKELKPKETKTT